MGQQIELALRQSVHRVVVTLVQFLPGLVAFLLALILLSGLGALLAAALRSILRSVRFDERLASRQAPGSLFNLTEWSPANSPTLFVSRVVWWVCVLAGFAIGIYAFDASFSGTEQVSLFFLPYVTHTAGAVLILIGGTLLARFLSRSVLIGAVNAQLQYARFLSLGIKWLVLVLATAMALDHLQIGGGIVELAFGILFGGIVLTLSLAIGLGSRDIVSRSIEKTIDKPAFTGPVDMGSSAQAKTPRATLHHF